jgi:hypothetical protein
LLASAYGLTPAQINMPDYLDEPYLVEGWVPERSQETMKPLMQAALLAGASIRIRHEQRALRVLVISGLPGTLQRAATDGDELLYNPKQEANDFSWKSVSAETIRSQIQSLPIAGGKPVVFDHPVSGQFVFSMKWSADDPGVLKRSLGLQRVALKEETRKVDVLVVESLTIAPGQ